MNIKVLEKKMLELNKEMLEIRREVGDELQRVKYKKRSEEESVLFHNLTYVVGQYQYIDYLLNHERTIFL